MVYFCLSFKTHQIHKPTAPTLLDRLWPARSPPWKTMTYNYTTFWQLNYRPAAISGMWFLLCLFQLCLIINYIIFSLPFVSLDFGPSSSYSMQQHHAQTWGPWLWRLIMSMLCYSSASLVLKIKISTKSICSERTLSTHVVWEWTVGPSRSLRSANWTKAESSCGEIVSMNPCAVWWRPLSPHLCDFRRSLSSVWACAVLRRRGEKPRAERAAPAIWWNQSLTLEETPRLETTRLLVGPLPVLLV